MLRYFVLLLVAVVISSGCKKQVEQVQLDALMELITSGEWKVTRFVKGADDVTGSFAPYSFQFKKDETVDAIKDGRVEKTGTWKGNTTDLTIQSSFGNVATPLQWLNGTWQVTRTSTTFVESNQEVGGETRTLRLDKK